MLKKVQQLLILAGNQLDQWQKKCYKTERVATSDTSCWSRAKHVLIVGFQLIPLKQLWCKKLAKVGMDLINDIRALREPGALEIAGQLTLPTCIA